MFVCVYTCVSVCFLVGRVQPVPFKQAKSTFYRAFKNTFEQKKNDGEVRKKENNRGLDKIQVP